MTPIDSPIDFRTTSLSDLAAAVRARQVSARELTTLALERIDALNPTYNAFVAVDAERALAEAAAVDEVTAKGGDPGALAGIPLAVKDNHDAVGYRSTFGAPVLADAPLAPVGQPLRGPPAGRRVRGRREDQPARVRLDGQHDQCPVRRHGQPLQPRLRRRRFVGRGGRRPGRGHGAAGHRFRRGRVDPDPLGRLRPLGHEALARAGARRRPQPARLARPLHQRSHGPPHRRRRDRPRCGCRPRPVRPALPAPP